MAAWMSFWPCVIDMCLPQTNAFSFMREAGGIDIPQQEVEGALVRWTIDMSQDNPQIVERRLGPSGNLPRLADADQGRPYARAWYLSMNLQGGPPMPGGPVARMKTGLALHSQVHGTWVSRQKLDPGKAAQ